MSYIGNFIISILIELIKNLFEKRLVKNFKKKQMKLFFIQVRKSSFILLCQYVILNESC